MSGKDFAAFQRNLLRRGNPNLVLLDKAPRLKASTFAEQLNATGKRRTRVTISFEYNGTKITQPFTLIKKRRGSARVWYFVCPITGKESYYLYFINGQYGHRDAFKGYVMYRRQTYSAKQRLIAQSRINLLKLPVIKDLSRRPNRKVLTMLKKIEKAKAKRQEYLAKYPNG